MLTNKKIANIIFKTTNLFFIIGVFSSFNLWFLKEREIPFISLIKLNNLDQINVLISICFVSLLCLNLMIRKRLIIIFTIVFLVILLLLDRMKWQPWIYFYLIVFCIYFFEDLKYKTTYFFLIKYLLGIMYFWAGVHKLSPSFLNSISYLFGSNFEKVKLFFALFPYFEMLIGLIIVLFPINKFLRYFLVSFHLLIIAFVISTTTNSIIIHWNLYYAVLILLLSFVNQSKGFEFPFKELRIRIIVLLFFCLPILNFVSKLDHYLAFSLYSGKVPQFFLIFESKDFSIIIEKEFKNSLVHSDKAKKAICSDQNIIIVSYYKHTMNILNVPPIMEKDVILFLKEYYSIKYPKSKMVLFTN